MARNTRPPRPWPGSWRWPRSWRGSGKYQRRPCRRFVLLRLSRDIATLACDGQAAFQAIDAMDRAYQINAPAMKLAGLAKFTPAARKAEDHKSIAEASLAVLDDALGQDNLATATQLQAMALAEAKRAGDPALVKRAAEYGDEIKSLAQIREAVRTASETLKTAPNDPGETPRSASTSAFRKAIGSTDWPPWHWAMIRS